MAAWQWIALAAVAVVLLVVALAVWHYPSDGSF